MRCKNCGFEMNTDNVKIKFCPVCGSLLDADEDKTVDEAQEEVFEEFADGNSTGDFASDSDGVIELEEVETPDDVETQKDVEEPLTIDIEEVDTYEDNIKHRALETMSAIENMVEETEVKVETNKSRKTAVKEAAEYFDKSYKNNMKHNYINSLWDHADEKYVSIEKGYAPNILEDSAKVGDISDYQQNLQTYNNRIKTEISGIKPQLQIANANLKQRYAAEWDKRVKAAKRNVTLKNIIALSIAAVMLIIGIIVTFAIKNTFRNVPFLDGLVGGVILSFYFLTVTVSVFSGMARTRKINKAISKNKKPAYTPTSIKARRLLSFLLGIAGVAFIFAFIGIEVSRAIEGNAEAVMKFTSNSLSEAVLVYFMCLLIGVCFGGGAALIVRALVRLFRGTKSNKQYSINYGDEASLKYLKKRGIGKLIAVIIFSVIFTAGGIASRIIINRIIINDATKPYYILGSLYNGDVKLTGMDESKIEGKTSFTLPSVSAIGKNFLPKDNNVETLFIPEDVEIDKGALGTAQKLTNLTVKLTDKVTLDYLFDGKIPETLTTVKLFPYAPSFLDQTSQSAFLYGIPAAAFKGAKGLTSVSILKPVNYMTMTLSYVGQDAFEGTALLNEARKEDGVSYVSVNGNVIAATVDKDAKDVILGSCDIVANGVFAPLLGKKINSLEISSRVNVGIPQLSVSDKVDYLFGKVNLSQISPYNNGTVVEVSYPSETYLTTEKLTYDFSNGSLKFAGVKAKTFEYTQTQTNDIYLTNIFGGHSDSSSYISYIETVIVNAGSSNSIKTGTFADCVSLKALYIKGDFDYLESRIFGSSYNDDTINVFFEKEQGEIELNYNWKGNASVNVTFGVDESTSIATVSGINYTYNTADGTAKVKGISEGASISGNVTINTVTIDGRNYKVTEILNFVTTINSIHLTIGENVKKIGDGAFRNCGALNTVTFKGKTSATASDGVDASEGLIVIGANAFDGCTSLTGVTLSGVEELGAYAFNGCYSLKSVNIEGEDLTTIGNYCFANTAIEAIFIPKSVVTVGEQIFSSDETYRYVDVYLEDDSNWNRYSNQECNTVKIGEFNETEVDDGVTFKYGVNGDEATVISIKTSKTEVTIPEVIDGKKLVIVGGVFDSLAAITRLTINGMPTVEHGALLKLQNLEELTVYQLDSVSNPHGSGTLYQTVADLFDSEDNIPSSLRKITVLGGSLYGNVQFANGAFETAFMGCDNVETLVLGANVMRIGDNSLSGLTGLKELTLPRVDSYIGRYFGYYPNVDADGNEGDFLSMQGSLPSTLKKITVTGQNGYGEIHEAAFACCPYISEVVLGDGITSIGDEAFAESGIISVTIGRNVNSIGTGAFGECDRLMHIRDLNYRILSASVEDRYTLYGIEEDVEVLGDEGSFSTQITESGGISTATKADGNKYILSYSGTSESLDLSSSGIYGIKSGAFANTNLKWIILPSSLKEISSRAFVDCENLVYVYIPSGVERVASNAFYHCRNAILAFAENDEPEWTSHLTIANVRGVRAGASISDVKTVESELVGQVEWFKSYTRDPAEFKINGKTAFIAKRNYPDGMEWESGNPDSTIFPAKVWYSNRTYCGDQVLSLEAQFDCEVYIEYGIINSGNISMSVKVNGITKDSLSYQGTRECMLTLKKGDIVKINYSNSGFGTCYGYVSSFKIIGGLADRTYDYSSLPSVDITNKELSSLTDDRGNTLFTASVENWDNIVLSGNAEWESTNKNHNSRSTLTLTANYDCQITISYKISSEENYDKGTIKVGDVTIVNGISGTSSGNQTVEVKKGQQIVITYAKDGSSSYGDDCFYITGFVVRAVI